MEIQTSSFGTQVINEDDILTFPQGLIGFEDQTQFKLFHEEHNSPTVYWLQSVTDPKLAMSVVSPAVFGLAYEIAMDDNEQALLELTDPADAIVLLVVYKQHEETSPDNVDIKAITRAPIVLNSQSKKGVQLSITHPNIKRLSIA